MTFSIIVVCYNAGEKLEKTIASIRGQTETDYEIIVQDGLSTDGSVERLSAGADLKLFRERDAGIYDAMNRAVFHAAGRYLFFLNCGDYFADREVLAEVKRAIEKKEKTAAFGKDVKGLNREKEAAGIRGGEKKHLRPMIFYGNIKERVTGAHVMSNPVIDDFACYRNVPCHQACFYDRRLLVKRGFRTCYRVRADYEHFLWCYYRARAAMVYLPFTVALYEGEGFSESGENRKRSAAEHAHIVKKYMGRGQILKYRLVMLLTFAPLRTYLASHKTTAVVYQKIKAGLYRETQGGKQQ
ncbi:MAG: glycosyltransferase [Lachnospiraceae bacterium]|nr:glycosyltransferase [Lachnospiraceae bacterium]